jgi:multiple sugar transport system permease protein
MSSAAAHASWRGESASRSRRAGLNRIVSGRGVRRAGLYLALILLLAIFDGPVFIIVIASFEPGRQIAAYPPSFLPHPWTLRNYRDLFNVSHFGQYLWHSLLISVVSTIGVVTLGTLGAYAMVRFRYKAIQFVGLAAIIAYMLPGILLLVPITDLIYRRNLSNNLVVVMLIYTSILLPFGLWTLRGYFQGVTVDLEQAAMVDGCTRFGAFRRVVLPQAVPGIVAVAIFAFNGAWGEYMFASVLLTTPQTATVSQGVVFLQTSNGVTPWGELMAASTLIVVLPVALYTIFQRYLVATWGAGAVKG